MKKYGERYDHILAYWGNYTATCAYIFHLLSGRKIPFSMFLHAGTDLYRNQVFLKQKLLYSDNIITVCEFNRHFIRTLYPDLFPLIEHKIKVHHLGLDINGLQFSLEREASNILVAIGNMNKKKGFDFLLHAISILRNRNIDVTLEFVGDGEEANNLIYLSKNLNISRFINYHGWVPFKEVQDVLSRATILVHPSSDLGDAVPTVIKESMALGTPVIASDIVGIPELLDGGRCGLLVPPRNSEKLADAIELLIRDSSMRRDYAIKARAFAKEKFDVRKNTQYLAQILRNSERM